MRKSTSFMKISGDGYVPDFKKAVYLFGNYTENSIGNMPRPKFRVRTPYFLKPRAEEVEGRLASPARVYSDLFWAGLPWQQMDKALGGICALEIGCGSGYLPAKIEEYLKKPIKYTGTDVYENPEWKKNETDRWHFQLLDISKGESISDAQTNLILSQSVLEHVPDDFQLMKNLRDHIEVNQKPTIQIHLVPSTSCLYTFLLHGYRQYSVCKLNRLKSIFSNQSHNFTVYPLGGRGDNKLHFKFISKLGKFGKDTRKLNAGVYSEQLTKLVGKNQHGPVNQCCFLAIVIESYLDTPVVNAD